MPLSTPRYVGPTSVVLGVSFGGGTTGVTYGTRSGIYTIHDKLIRVQFYLELTSIGSDTGIAAITGLPFVATSAAYAYGSKSPILINNGTSLPDQVMVSVDPGQIIGYVQYQSPTVVGTLTEGNFTNTSVLTGTITYIGV